MCMKLAWVMEVDWVLTKVDLWVSMKELVMVQPLGQASGHVMALKKASCLDCCLVSEFQIQSRLVWSVSLKGLETVDSMDSQMDDLMAHATARQMGSRKASLMVNSMDLGNELRLDWKKAEMMDSKMVLR